MTSKFSIGIGGKVKVKTNLATDKGLYILN